MAGSRVTDIPSYILDARKKTFREAGAVPPLTPGDTLEHVPYVQSTLNATSRLHLLHKKGELPIDPSTGKPFVDILEEQPLRVIFKSSVPINGKTAFTVAHQLSRPLKDMRPAIAQLLRITASGMTHLPNTPSNRHLFQLPASVTMHRADTLERLDEGLTFLEQGFRFVPVIHLKGFGHAYALMTCGSESRLTIEWSPHHTVTELVQEVWRRVRPYDLRLCRLSTHTIPPGMVEPKLFRIDAARSVVYEDDVPRGPSGDRPPAVSSAPSPRLDPNARLCDVAAALTPSAADAGSAASPSDPIAALFFRSKNSQRLWFDLAAIDPISTGAAVITGLMTVGELRDLMLALDSAKRLGEVLMVKPPPEGEASGPPTPVTEFHRGGPQEQLVELLESDGPYDDADEEVSPGGERIVYCHGLHPQLTFSFNPPLSVANQYKLGPKQFVTIDEDYCIGHLSDCGIFPLSEVLVEFFNPHAQEWSQDVANRLTAEEAAHPDLAPADLLTVRCDRGQVIRIPASPLTKVASLLERVFCAVGMLPMFTLLRTSTGRILQEYETLMAANLLPHATLFASHRPRPWFGEALADVPASDYGLPDPAL